MLTDCFENKTIFYIFIQNKDNLNIINHLLLFLYLLNITTTKEFIAVSIVYSLQGKVIQLF